MLADMSGIEETAIRDFERKLAEPSEDIRFLLQRALEAHGALFLTDDSHGGQGVRLKFTTTEAARIERLENEGGLTADDDVID